MEKDIDMQFDLSDRIKCSFDIFVKTNPAKITNELVEAQLKSLETKWKRFETRHDNIVATYKDVFEHDYYKKKTISVTENIYIVQKDLFRNILRESQVSVEAPAADANTSQPPRTTLPIDLLQFSEIEDQQLQTQIIEQSSQTQEHYTNPVLSVPSVYQPTLPSLEVTSAGVQQNLASMNYLGPFEERFYQAFPTQILPTGTQNQAPATTTSSNIATIHEIPVTGYHLPLQEQFLSFDFPTYNYEPDPDVSIDGAIRNFTEILPDE